MVQQAPHHSSTDRSGGGEALADMPTIPRRSVHMFVGLLGFWLLLMGAVDLQRVLAGALVAAVVTAFWSRPVGKETEAVHLSSLTLLFRPAFLRYALLMGWEVLRANWAVARVVLDPKLPISPMFVLVNTKLKHDLTRVIYATSITLTPGTLSVSLDDDTLIVHALTQGSANAIRDWPVEDRVRELEQAWRA